MHGMDRNTGQLLTGLAHLRQSITDLLTTPLGSRLMQRDYGSRLYELVDHPINSATTIEIYMAVASALNRWEPRFKLQRVEVVAVQPGKIQLRLSGEYLPDAKPIVLESISL